MSRFFFKKIDKILKCLFRDLSFIDLSFVMIIGHYGVINWGDEAILSGLLQSIKTDVRFKNLTPVVVSANPQFTSAEYKVESVAHPPFGFRSFFSFRWFSFFKALQQSSAVIIGGGGLFQPNPWRALWIWAYHLFWALLWQKQVYILGNSFEAPQKKGIIIPLLTKFLSKVTAFSTRDEFSKQVLIDFWKVNPSKITVQKDFAYSIIPQISIPQKKNGIIFIMREGDLSLEEEKILLESVKTNFPNEELKVVSMQSSQAHDEAFAKRYNLPCIIPNHLWEVLEAIHHATLVVSSRLHGNILADVLHTPFIPIITRSKTKALFSGVKHIKKKDLKEGFEMPKIETQ